MSKINKVAEFVFSRNPKADKVFIASDGRAFFTQHEAEAFASRLKDGKIEVHSRDKEEVKVLDIRHGEQEIKQKDPIFQESDDKSKKEAQPNKSAEVMALDALSAEEMANYLESLTKLKLLKALAERLEVTVEGKQSKEAYRQAIAAHFAAGADTKKSDTDATSDTGAAGNEDNQEDSGDSGEDPNKSGDGGKDPADLKVNDPEQV